MVGVGRPVTCRINGCGGLQVAHGAGCREAEEEPRSGGGRTTPGLREDHTAPPRATEPRATVARCQPHLITSQQTPLTRESGKDIFQFHLVMSCDKSLSVEPSAAIKVMLNYGMTVVIDVKQALTLARTKTKRKEK